VQAIFFFLTPILKTGHDSSSGIHLLLLPCHFLVGKGQSRAGVGRGTPMPTLEEMVMGEGGASSHWQWETHYPGFPPPLSPSSLSLSLSLSPRNLMPVYYMRWLLTNKFGYFLKL
jgi:hypothetical protein